MRKSWLQLEGKVVIVTGNGVNVVSDINKLFSIYQLPNKVFADSFKNIQQVHDFEVFRNQWKDPFGIDV